MMYLVIISKRVKKATIIFIVATFCYKTIGGLSFYSGAPLMVWYYKICLLSSQI